MENKLPKGPWNIWAIKRPPVPGDYWIAGWFPEEPFSIEEPTLWNFNWAEICCDDPTYIMHYCAKNFIWCGPLTVPEFTSEK